MQIASQEAEELTTPSRLFISACVCGVACVCERERERETGSMSRTLRRGLSGDVGTGKDDARFNFFVYECSASVYFSVMMVLLGSRK